MPMIERNRARLMKVSLPSPAFVADLRGDTDQDHMIESVKAHLDDVSEEMWTQAIPHWRFLRDFISLGRLSPLSLQDLRQARAADGLGSSATASATSSPATPSGFASLFQPSSQQGTFVPPALQNEPPSSAFGGYPLAFQYALEACARELDRLRKNRNRAVANFPKDDPRITSVNRLDEAVRLILVTDANQPESLSSAAAYAACLKSYYLRQAASDLAVTTIVVCLNHSNEAVAQARLREHLVWNERWDHIDVLILSQKYYEHAERIEHGMQLYLAELLLYVLLLAQTGSLAEPLPDQALIALPR